MFDWKFSAIFARPMSLACRLPIAWFVSPSLSSSQRLVLHSKLQCSHMDILILILRLVDQSISQAALARQPEGLWRILAFDKGPLADDLVSKANRAC